MYGTYMNNEAAALWNNLLQRREKRRCNRERFDNVTGLINLLSQCLPHEQPRAEPPSKGIYNNFFGRGCGRPYGYAVSIAIEMLPGKASKKSSKNIKK
ncbi:MAG: hypothetical protein IKA52_02295 [Bacteroidaceae bacterium]|nr:hypothetical protein [Bacteroidaceae bacterium]MBR6649602.1 hypothetical protein [Bacteroidaceae bacterium]